MNAFFSRGKYIFFFFTLSSKYLTPMCKSNKIGIKNYQTEQLRCTFKTWEKCNIYKETKVSLH